MDLNSQLGSPNPEGRRSMSPPLKLATARSRSSSPHRTSVDAPPSPTAATSMMTQDRMLTPPPYPPAGYTSTGYEDPEQDDSWRDRHPSLPRWGLPIALLVGISIAAGATYAVVAWVQRLQGNATVDPNIAKWKTEAREKVYNACYFGCQNDSTDKGCADPSFAFDACQKTAQVNVPGVICDGNKMWNWREEARFPDKCLEAVGKMLQGDALEDVKDSHKSKLGLIAVTIIAGILGGVAVFFLWRRFSRSKRARQAAKEGRPARTRTWKPSTWRNNYKQPEKSHDTNDSANPFSDQAGTELRSPSHSPSRGFRSRSRSRSRSSSRSARLRGGNGRRGFQLFTAFLALFGKSRASGTRNYPCTRELAFDQYFTLDKAPAPGFKGTVLSGVIHGWLTECKDTEDCRQSCHNSCKTVNGKKKCSDKCTKKCHTKTTTNRMPKSFVDAVAPKVKACGFKLVDGLGGKGNAEARYRVPNGKIEKSHWVEILVTGFNVTNADKTDQEVVCLYNIGV